VFFKERVFAVNDTSDPSDASNRGSLPLIETNELVPSSSIPFHKDHPAIKRHAPTAFPVHVAVHEVSDAVESDACCSERHSHPVPEIDLLIAPPGELVYRIELDGVEHEVSSPASVWIPAGVVHAANVVRGSGTFVCAVFADTETAFQKKR
jgi:hypothetical protein